MREGRDLSPLPLMERKAVLSRGGAPYLALLRVVEVQHYHIERRLSGGWGRGGPARLEEVVAGVGLADRTSGHPQPLGVAWLDARLTHLIGRERGGQEPRKHEPRAALRLGLSGGQAGARGRRRVGVD